MLQINEKEMSDFIHDLVNIIQVLKTIEGHCRKCQYFQLDCDEQMNNVHDCELKLTYLRRKILESLSNDNET